VDLPGSTDGPRRIQYIHGWVGGPGAYERAVNRQREREGLPSDFRAAERRWGERDGSLVYRGDREYVEIRPIRRLLDLTIDPAGRAIPRERAELAAGRRQGVAAPIEIRTYRLDTIIEARIDGEVLR
jgi:hypothetical protein